MVWLHTPRCRLILNRALLARAANGQSISPSTLATFQEESAARARRQSWSEHGFAQLPRRVSLCFPLQRYALVNRGLDDCGASSSNRADTYVSDARRQDKSGGVGSGRPGMRGPRGRPSCDSRGATSRKHGPGHVHRWALQRRQWSRLPQRPPSGKVLLRIALLGAYIVLQTAIPGISILKSR
jgi:hypothetical protein